MTLTITQTIGMLVSILGIAGLAIYSGTKPQTYANVNTSPIIAGIIMGTLVGGSSTVGTAQLAYNYGLSAWWFTLGGGIACLVLALVYVKPLRNSGCMTLVGIIRKEFGPGAGLAASMFNSVGTFINIISQLLSGTAVIAVVAPSMGIVPALIITAGFMALYVIAGGTQGAGRVGILKLILLYISMIGCGMMVLFLSGGFHGFKEMVAGIENTDGVNFYSLFARGAGKDGGACLSLILGVLTTQTYAQAVMSGKTDKSARTGALISAALIPPIGAGGILVGLFMRANYPGIVAKTALTAFATEHLPGILCGLVLGTLFIAVVGTGAGLALGISTIVRRDIIQRFTDKLDSPKANMVFSRIIIVIVLAVGCCLSTGSLGDTILNFAFMSMGLRGAVVFVPLCCAIWLHGKVNKKCALAAIIAGPVAVLLFGTVLTLPAGIDPLFAGVAASLLCCLVGLLIGNRKSMIKIVNTSAVDCGNLVIAIDSELCSGSKEVAEELSKILSIPLYDDEILTVASEKSGIPERLLRKYEGRPVVAAYDMSAEDESEIKMPPAQDFAAAQTQACKAIAWRGPCILLDHFACNAMENDPGCIKIFIQADFEKRADAYAAENKLGPATARKELKRVDKEWQRCYKSGSSAWGNADSYTLTVDTSGSEADAIAESLIGHIETVIGRSIVEREELKSC